MMLRPRLDANSSSLKPMGQSVECSPLFRSFLLSLPLALINLGSVSSQPLPPDFVSQLRTKLETPTQDRAKTAIQLIEKMNSTGELSRALLLPEWQGQYLDGDNLEIFNTALDRFVRSAQKGLESGTIRERKQTARIIAETGSVNSGASTIGGAERSVARDPAFRRAFIKLQDTLFKLAEADKDVREDALYCLGRIDCAPDRLGALASKILQNKMDKGPSDLSEKLAAAESLKARANSISTLVRQRRALNIEELTRSRANFMAVANAVIPAAVIGLGDPSVKVAVLSSDCVNEITEAMVDSDIIIQVRDLDPSIQEGNDVFTTRIATVRQDQKDLLPLAKTLRTNSTQILGLGLKPGQLIEARRETILLLEDFAVIRKKMYDQELRLRQAESLAGIKSPEDRLRELEVFPLSEEGSTSILKALLAGMADKEPEIRISTAKAIEAIIGLPDILTELRNSDRDRLLDGILAELDDDNVYVQINLIRVLGMIAPGKSEKIVPALVNFLGSPDIDVRIQTVNALKFFEGKAASAVPALCQVLDQGDAEFRIVGMKAVEAIGLRAVDALPKVAANLRHSNPEVRAYASKVLGRFGKAAQGQLAELEKLARDPSQDVRLRAEEAILQILSRKD